MKSLQSIFGKKFTQHYQPIVDMQSLDLVRYEALLRPLGFSKDTEALIRQMEKAGEIRELDLWSIKTALARLENQGGSPIVAINLSAKSLCDPIFHEEVEWLLMGKADTTRIGFEITESEPITDLRMARRFVAMAQSLNCSVGLDDFGVGNARFRVAEQMELNYIKLAARLTTMIDSSTQARSMIEKAVKMTNLYGMQIVAEHIDKPMQYAWLRDTGVTLGQGWLFDKATSQVQASRNFRPELEKAIYDAFHPAEVSKTENNVFSISGAPRFA